MIYLHATHNISSVPCELKKKLNLGELQSYIKLPTNASWTQQGVVFSNSLKSLQPHQVSLLYIYRLMNFYLVEVFVHKFA